MHAALRITVIWHDDDVVQLRVTGSNGRFAGQADTYVSPADFDGLPDSLVGFPSSTSDVRELELGAFGPDSAGGGVRLRFSCRDSAGHTQVEARFEGDHVGSAPPEAALVYAEFEPAAFDQFVTGLRHIARNRSGEAILAAAV
jgi:hypothetical protein